MPENTILQEGLCGSVWLFANSSFISGVFTSKERAQNWIEENKLTGLLSEYPLNRGVYDWAVENDYFQPKREDQRTPMFIARFVSGMQVHMHFENGIHIG